MQFFANPTSGAAEAMRKGLLGMIDTPAQGNVLPDGVDWVADNGCFTGGYPGDDGFIEWAGKRTALAERCAFVVAPDVARGPNGELAPNAAATLARSAPILPRIRDLGFPAALVAQNGLEDLVVPWDDFDALFIGGDDAWKLGPAARGLVREAKAHGKHVHMGRVNSLKRLRYAQAIGCDSVDGTYLVFGPDKNLPKLLGWLRAVHQPTQRVGRQSRRPPADHPPLLQVDHISGEVVA